VFLILGILGAVPKVHQEQVEVLEGTLGLAECLWELGVVPKEDVIKLEVVVNEASFVTTLQHAYYTEAKV
jgi:hypothetical protein